MTTTAQDIAQGITWDLSALFSSMEDEKIAGTWASCNARAEAFAAKYRGKVADLNVSDLVVALQELEDLSNEAAKPPTYANLLFAADTSNPSHGAFLAEQSEKASEVRVKVMFFDLELQKIEQSKLDAMLEDPALAVYRHHFAVVRAYTPYMLSETEEVLLEETSNTGVRAWVRLHDEVTANHDFRYIDPLTDETLELSQEEVLDRLRDPDRRVRQAAGDALSNGLAQIERVVTFAYNTVLADKKLEDRLRKMEYPERSRHLANELDKETVDLVMQLCKERSDLVARYYRVKKKILGLEELTHVDRYAPLFEAEEKIGWDEAKEMVLTSFGAFHPKMREVAEEFYTKNWIDAEARKGKTGGAFCNYNTPDTHPVMLMTYLGNLKDVGTLAHELGHCVHGSLSRKQSLFNFHGTLPLAELASIFGEILVFERVVGNASLKDKIALYADKIEGIFASVHRQSAMFRFEQKCHTHRREQGELSSQEFGDYWQAELQSMFEDAVKLGEQHRRWWMYVGHFFFAPFYVYAYSFGELLTMALFEKAKQEGPDFADRYVHVLELGGSKNPDELMAILGVDLHSREFWEGGFAVIEGLVGEFEKLWAEDEASN